MQYVSTIYFHFIDKQFHLNNICIRMNYITYGNFFFTPIWGVQGINSLEVLIFFHHVTLTFDVHLWNLTPFSWRSSCLSCSSVVTQPSYLTFDLFLMTLTCVF